MTNDHDQPLPAEGSGEVTSDVLAEGDDGHVVDVRRCG